MVPVGSSVMLELVLAVHSYHVIAHLEFGRTAKLQVRKKPAITLIPSHISSLTLTFVGALHDVAAVPFNLFLSSAASGNHSASGNP